MRKLKQILSYKRPAGSDPEREMINKFIKPTGAFKDAFGNYILVIGTAPVLWSCHTDTVHHKAGYQTVDYDSKIFSLRPYEGTKTIPHGNCLGADDGAGVWLMLKMIEAGIGGVYIFHRAEESGGQGSHFSAENNKELLKNIKYCIAFDRRGTTDLITHQGGMRTCSDKFGKSLIKHLKKAGGFKKKTAYSLCRGGSFTDSKNYIDIIPECTNLAVGYYGNHSIRETLDANHIFRLKEAMLTLDLEALVVDRKAGERELYQSAWEIRNKEAQEKVHKENKAGNKGANETGTGFYPWGKAENDYHKSPRFRVQDEFFGKAYMDWEEYKIKRAQAIRNGITPTPYEKLRIYGCVPPDYVAEAHKYEDEKQSQIIDIQTYNKEKAVEKAVQAGWNAGEALAEIDNHNSGINTLCKPLRDLLSNENIGSPKDQYSDSGMGDDDPLYNADIRAHFGDHGLSDMEFRGLCKMAKIIIDYPGEITYLLKIWGYDHDSLIRDINKANNSGEII